MLQTVFANVYVEGFDLDVLEFEEQFAEAGHGDSYLYDGYLVVHIEYDGSKDFYGKEPEEWNPHVIWTRVQEHVQIEGADHDVIQILPTYELTGFLITESIIEGQAGVWFLAIFSDGTEQFKTCALSLKKLASC